MGRDLLPPKVQAMLWSCLSALWPLRSLDDHLDNTVSVTEHQSAVSTHTVRPFSPLVGENPYAAVTPVYSICEESSATL